jgi:NADPH:quinone reductase-like Zn-dependent oxidoreductase
MTMKAIEIRGTFGLESLELVERPVPKPGPGQALLRMRAASLNYRDLLTVRGAYNPKQPLPLIPCSDGVGEVVALGPGAEHLQKGQRVCPTFCQGWISGAPTRGRLRSTLGGPLDGTLAEYMLIDARSAVEVPAFLSDEEAAALPCAAVTAWTALVTEGRLRAGDVVVVQGTGGVSIAALQIGRLLGARVIVTSSSEDKLRRAIKLGASDGINYQQEPKWASRVRELTDGVGADHVVEVGGANTLGQSLKAVRVGGSISVIGVLTGIATEVNLIPLLMQYVKLQGILVGHRESFEALCRALETGQTRPVVDRVWPLEQTRQALEHMASGDHFGKICIRIG